MFKGIAKRLGPQIKEAAARAAQANTTAPAERTEQPIGKGFRAAIKRAAQAQNSAPPAEVKESAGGGGGFLKRVVKNAASNAAQVAKASPAANAPSPARKGFRGIVKSAAEAAAAVAKKNEEEVKTKTAASQALQGMKDAVKKGPFGSIRRKLGLKKGGMVDKTGRAMTRKTADTKGRAMKKGK